MKTIADNKRINILQEQFVPDNVFLYVSKGAIRFFDGKKDYTLLAGEFGIARKNCLLKYQLLESNDNFEPIMFCFDEVFLKSFQKKHQPQTLGFGSKDSCINIPKTKMLDNFMSSIKPYYKGVLQLDDIFQDIKNEELLLILLKQQPELSDMLFNFSKPGKIDLEEFINLNYMFNVNMERLAFLTGRSLSAFKRDFKEVFGETPSRWLIRKRLQEAHFLIERKNKKPSKIYLDLGFETLSHFSVAFKKEFGITPRDLRQDRY